MPEMDCLLKRSARSLSRHAFKRGGGYSPVKMMGCSLYLSGGKICELLLLRVLKPKMTPAKVVTVPFRDLKVHRSEKMKKPNHIVTQRTFISEFLQENSHAIGISCCFKIGTS